MFSGDTSSRVRRVAVDESIGGAFGAPRARQPLLLSLAIALLLLAGAAFGLARSSHGAPEPPASLDRLRVPPALMPPPPPRTPLSDHRIQVGGGLRIPKLRRNVRAVTRFRRSSARRSSVRNRRTP